MNRLNLSAALLALAFTAPTWAADDAAAQQRHQQERAHCMSGKSHQDQATCLREADNAYDAAKKGALASGAGSDLQKNATARCEAQPAADRAACVERILGAGSTEGSVKGGGLIRQTETKLP